MVSSWFYKYHLIELAGSFFTTWALMKASRMEPGNILTLVFFLFCLFFYHYVQKKRSNFEGDLHRITRIASIFSVIFTLFYMLMDYPHYIETLTSRLFRFGILAVVAIGFWFLFYEILLAILLSTQHNDRLSSLLYGTRIPDKWIFLHKHAFPVTFLLCMLGWLPYYLYQFPGIMTPDSINQLEQVLGLIPYSNHHPWIHTLFIKLFYTIGYTITGSMVAAMGFYTLMQMCFLAASISYFVSSTRIFHLKPIWGFLLALAYALLPYHAVYSVTVWKDIPFAAAVLLFLTALLRIHNRNHRSDYIIFILSGIMMCVFRSNGWYAFLLCLPFLLFFLRRNKYLIGSLAITLCMSILIRYPVMNASHVVSPDFVESLCIPLQQVSCVLANDRDLTPEQNEMIDQVIDRTYVKELYNPTFADNMKELVRAGNPQYLEDHKTDFLKLWISLGLKYPGDYLEAYIQQTNGYWYPDSYYLVAEAEGISATSLGISHTPLIRGPLVVKGKEIAIKLGSMIPLYGTLWSMGVIFWIFLICIACILARRDYSKLLYTLPCLTLWFTVMIATPVATEFRYVYFLILCLPFYLVTTLADIKW